MREAPNGRRPERNLDGQACAVVPISSSDADDNRLFSKISCAFASEHFVVTSHYDIPRQVGFGQNAVVRAERLFYRGVAGNFALRLPAIAGFGDSIAVIGAINAKASCKQEDKPTRKSFARKRLQHPNLPDANKSPDSLGLLFHLPSLNHRPGRIPSVLPALVLAVQNRLFPCRFSCPTAARPCAVFASSITLSIVWQFVSLGRSAVEMFGCFP